MLLSDPAQRPSASDCCQLFHELTCNAFKLKMYAPVRWVDSRLLFWIGFFPLCLRAAARTLRQGRQELFSHAMIQDGDREASA
ncbi:hypothetical protein PLICRDRAFT_257763 [Plicaturopsis crispa FD-325 SS-3]|nr:hypothetical protein PLICRDRAFT_257763 [Plicaturopsis crispa FD-325 SS-3]